MEAKTNEIEYAEGGFHEGNTILNLANFYSDPFDVVKEVVQNSIDEKAKNIKVDINISKKDMKVFDDGRGMSKDTMIRRCKKICLSEKGEGNYGSKGIGNFAGLAIAEEIKIISKDLKTGVFNELAKKKAELKNEEKVKFPIKERPDFKADKKYNTLWVVRSIEKGPLKKLQKFEELCGYLSDALEEKLQDEKEAPKVIIGLDNKGIISEKQIKASEFPGTRQENPIAYKTTYGEITFEVFVGPEAAKKPKFTVRHHPITFDLKEIKDLYEEVKDVFGSGHFQGSVSVKFCTLDPSKKGFVWDDEFETFCDIVKKFAEEYLKPWLEELKDTKRSLAISELLREVLDDLENFFKDNPDLIPEGLQGLISAQHKGADPTKVDFRGKRKERKLTKRDLPRLEKKREGKEKKERRHSVARDDEAGAKQSAKQQPGAVIDYDNTAIGARWRSRFKNGRIIINALHKDFDEAERKGRKAWKHYCSQLVWLECACLEIPNEYFRGNFRKPFEDLYFPFSRSWTGK